jgi:hypothetical protein
MAESGQSKRPDAAPGSRDDVTRPVRGNEPIDKTGARGGPSDPGAPAEGPSQPKPSAQVTPRDVATEADWPGAGRARTPDRPANDGQAPEQAAQDPRVDHAQVEGEARARLTASDPGSGSRGQPVERAGPT